MRITRRQLLKGALALGGWLALTGPRPAAPVTPTAPRWPSYLDLENRRELAGRVSEALELLNHCELCPRRCGADRAAGERGFCRAPAEAVVYSAHPHFGEERPLTGRRGSGTIFFSHCNLRCVFCQNWPISHEGHGRPLGDDDLAEMMLHFQGIGCHNLNLVTPTHMMPNILSAVRIAAKRGLTLPLVYNTSGYERVEILRLLDGVVDIYLPDMKYTSARNAGQYSAGAHDYPEVTRTAILEMQRQVGRLSLDEEGIARRGLMIRHLVMPNRVAGTEAFARWVSQNLPKDTYINIMGQYHVDYQAYDHPEIARAITAEEFIEAMAWAEQSGLNNLDPDSLRLRDFYRRRSAGQ